LSISEYFAIQEIRVFYYRLRYFHIQQLPSTKFFCPGYYKFGIAKGLKSVNVGLYSMTRKERYGYEEHVLNFIKESVYKGSITAVITTILKKASQPSRSKRFRRFRVNRRDKKNKPKVLVLPRHRSATW